MTPLSKNAPGRVQTAELGTDEENSLIKDPFLQEIAFIAIQGPLILYIYNKKHSAPSLLAILMQREKSILCVSLYMMCCCCLLERRKEKNDWYYKYADTHLLFYIFLLSQLGGRRRRISRAAHNQDQTALL